MGGVAAWMTYLGAMDVDHRRMARDGHGLPKISPEPAQPDPSMPFGWATPETAIQPFLG
jgi:hypothetical protein